ncbi:MAG TPA: IS66 family transposase [Pseudomonas sp.]|uniref:IS66 family transposase n=1 Tax=Pseudomonas sp. TaxID=306 RepID=UPI002CD5AEB5|nr:IS66 family transposase [Pseudomonas sp.]HSX89818.1 IS66 family transposase [Pseudomonas sp.]
MIDIAQIDPDKLDALDAEQLRELTRALLSRSDREIAWRDAKIDKLTFELAQLKRLKFDRSSEQMSAEQRALFDEAVNGDIAAIDEQLAALQATLPPKAEGEKKSPKRTPLPERLPRRDVHHEPADTRCGCGQTMKRVGEDVSEKLDYTPGVFTVERHVRGKWCCAACRTLVQAPVAPAVIDKGIPTAGLLAHVLVAKHADHLPLYRQEAIFGRAGLAIPRATLGAWVGQCGARLEPVAQALKAELLRCQVLHADETPVAMLAPGKGKTQRAYLWAYAAARSEPIKAVVYDFTPGRSGEHARAFLGHDAERRERGQAAWAGRLVCDDFSGYKALFELGVTEVGCMAHARRKFVELHSANKSSIAGTALDLFGQLYQVERDIQDLQDPAGRLQQRRSRSAPIAQALHEWLTAQRAKVPGGTATAKAIDYSLNRWAALTRYIEDPRLPIDNNHDEQQIRPWATGRKNWLFAGTLAAGQRAAVITSLIQSAKLNGHDPYVYLKDVLQRLPTQRASEIEQLLPHRWSPPA